MGSLYFKQFFFILLCWVGVNAAAQTASTDSIQKSITDSLINEKQQKSLPVKVMHAEPLYVDLIRDLGAHKGEKEWNVGFGLTDQQTFDKYTALVEYEFAPVNRLGFEVELPFTFYLPINGYGSRETVPGSRLNSLKLAGQWSFLVSEKAQTTLALGYIHEFELPAFKKYGNERFLKGHVYNPFFIAAKRWGDRFHSLLYTGPYITQHYKQPIHSAWQVNTSFHYMIPGTRNFLGMELNKDITRKDFDMTIRPQLRVSVADNLLIGIVTGVPIRREVERFSSFIRLIYEPKHKHS